MICERVCLSQPFEAGRQAIASRLRARGIKVLLLAGVVADKRNFFKATLKAP